MDDLERILAPRHGHTHDPAWDAYHRWPWDHFPIRLPACLIERSQRPLETGPATAVIEWIVERGVPLIARLDDADGKVLCEVLPRTAPPDSSAGGPFRYRRSLDRAALEPAVGFGFEWVFALPLAAPGRYQPHKALGIVECAAAELLGRTTVIAVRGRTRAEAGSSGSYPA